MPLQESDTPDEPRTVRDARLAIRDLEAALERVHMAPASALALLPGLYLRRARLALRQAERHFAEADDPRLEPLKPLRAQLSERRPSLLPRKRRYRCPECFREALLNDDDLAYYEGKHKRCGVEWEPVSRLRGRS